MAENEFVKILTKLGGGSEGGQRFRRSLLPLPEPDRIEMGVAHKEEFFRGHVSLPVSWSHEKMGKERRKLSTKKQENQHEKTSAE